jgi:SepF-like predicted cell division protein (DUF552 family)
MNQPNLPTSQYRNVLFEELGLEGASDEHKAELVEQMATIVQNRIAMRIVDVLGEAQLNELNKLIEAGDDLAVGTYLEQNVPDYQAIVAEEIRRLKVELHEDVAEINQGLDTFIANSPKNT